MSRSQLKRIPINAVASALLIAAIACGSSGAQESGGLRNPVALTEQAPATFSAAFDTSKGRFVVEVHREWAPRGADRFYNLVKNGFYDDCRFFRVIDKSGGVHEVKIEETEPYAFKGCGPCFDFGSELADVSVGSVGSPGGWSTVLTRTDAGEKLYASALKAGAVQEKAISEKGLALAKKLAGGKGKRSEEKSKELGVSGITR